MKTLGIAAAFLITSVLTCFALSSILADRPAQAQQAPSAPERPLVFVPGLLGSMLCRVGPAGEHTVVWGTVDAIGQFPSLAATATGNDIEPCGLIREISYLGIFTQTVYGPFVDRLEQAGYREGETLFVFDYDWRLSVFDNAKRLDAFVDAAIAGSGPIDIVGHSMGGLIARTYAMNEGGSDRIARMVSAGSPWRGSVQVFELLQNGWGLANSLLGGLDGFRRTIISFPSTFELMPQYDGCCGDNQLSAAHFDTTSVEAWAGLNWAGIDQDGLPDLAEVKSRQAELRKIFDEPLPSNVEEALVIGVDQRTPQQYELQSGTGEARLNVSTSWEGDGTVMRDSAVLSDRVTYPTSFATHDAILSNQSVQDFVLATLSQGPEAAIKIVPVRERTSILTALGDLVELVGVAIETDQPIYATGAVATATIHLRLGVEDPVDAGAIKLTVQTPDGSETVVPLTSAPQASDPGNPFEQSFSARIPTGGLTGSLTLTVALENPGSPPRVVNRVVPVLAQ